MIKLDNLLKIYTDEVRIGPLNLEIPSGGVTSIIGPNGAGKSTALLTIGRLLKLDGGKVFIGGKDIETTPSNQLAKLVSILKQENHFVTRLTVRQLVGFGRFPYSKGKLTLEDERIISKYIDLFGLIDLESRFLEDLSGGQRQRAYVAMIMAQETDYVLLDEPLNNLDVARSVEMMNHLRFVCKELDKTVVLVIHDINFAAKYSDEIIAMKDGQVFAQGHVRDIMVPDLLSKAFDTEIEVISNETHGPIAVFK